MPKRNIFLGSMLSIGLLLGGIGYSQVKAPTNDISAKKHPNLAAAQRLCDQAFQKIQAAQSANEFDLGGHAAKAKELLDKASSELHLAAQASNKNHM